MLENRIVITNFTNLYTAIYNRRPKQIEIKQKHATKMEKAN